MMNAQTPRENDFIVRLAGNLRDFAQCEVSAGAPGEEKMEKNTSKQAGLSLPEMPAHAEKIRMQRLTLDMPASLHQAIKLSCASRGTTIKDEIVALLRMYYPDKS